MVTTLYWHDADFDTTSFPGTYPINRHSGSAPTVQGGSSPWNDDNEDTSVHKSMTRTKGSSMVTFLHTNDALSSAQSYYITKFISDPLDGDQTIAANQWTFNYAIKEVHTAANFKGMNNLYLYVWRPSTGALVGWIYNGTVHDYGEIAFNVIGLRNNIEDTNGSSVSALDGDVIIMEVWTRIQTDAAYPYPLQWYYDGSTVQTGANNDTVSDIASYIQTPQDLVFVTDTPPEPITMTVTSSVSIDDFGLSDGGTITI